MKKGGVASYLTAWRGTTTPGSGPVVGTGASPLPTQDGEESRGNVEQRWRVGARGGNMEPVHTHVGPGHHWAGG